MLFLTTNSDKMYQQFKNKFNKYSVLPIEEIYKIFPAFDRRRLVEWQKKGYIENIKRGFYRFSDQPKSSDLCFFTANKIYAPSYISLESALAAYQIIPEAVFSFTSVSTLNTTDLNTNLGNFIYKHIKKELFFGYHLIRKNNITIAIANIEKAAMDFLYLNSNIKSIDDFEALRWNKSTLKQLDWTMIEDYEKVFKNNALNNRLKILKKYLND